MSGPTGARYFLDVLVQEGVDVLFGLTGSQFLDVLDLVREDPRLRFVLTRHEQGAGYMALGAALATGRPQAYTVVPGPGLLNSATALLQAHGTCAPVPRSRPRPARQLKSPSPWDIFDGFLR